MKGPASSQVQGLDGNGVGVGVGTPGLYPATYLPLEVTEVPRETVRAFSHNKRVGTYLLGRSLGEGSFAKVKEALHLPTGEKVAVKVIDKKRAKTDPYVRKNLRREGRLLQQVRHQHVVQLLEVLETEHSYYLVTEYCAGGDLMDYIAKRKKLEEREVRRFIRQIVSAVDYLHRLGIIHRDLKIENLLLDQNKDIKIIDFGLSNTIKATTAPEGTAHPQEFLVTQCGSPAYAAPELLNHRKYGLQVDVWSIGVNMYAMLTGTLPFTVDPFNIKTLYNKMISGQMNPVPESLSRDGKDILQKFLTADPEKRVTIADALRHPWLTESRNSSIERPPFPNKLKPSDLDTDILKHMSENLGFRMSEIIRFVVGNVPSSACATYHLYFRKLQRYNRHHVRDRLKADSKAEPPGKHHVEPTRISLVLQDMTPRATNHGAPARTLYTRKDSCDNEAPGSRDRHMTTRHKRLSSERTKITASSGAETGKESILLTKDPAFLSSLEHSLEDVRAEAKENSDSKVVATRTEPAQSHPSHPAVTTNSLQGTCDTGDPRMIKAIQKHLRATLPGQTGYVLHSKVAATKMVHYHGTVANGAGGSKAGAENGTPRPKAPVSRTSTGASLGSTMSAASRHSSNTIGETTGVNGTASRPHHLSHSEHGSVSPTRKGRVLVPLNKTIAMMSNRRPSMHASVKPGGAHYIPGIGGTKIIDSLYSDRSTSPGPRVDGSQIHQRATGPYPASSVSVNGSLMPSPHTTAVLKATNGHHPSRSPRQLYNRRGSTQGAGGAGSPQWRSVAPPSSQRLADSGDTTTPRPSNEILTSKLARKDGDHHSSQSKRPVSPQAPPLVRRRLAKRSRQDGLRLHHRYADDATHHADNGTSDDDRHIPDDTDAESVAVERLATSQEGRNVSRATGLSEASSVTRDLHALPAISTIVSNNTPRH